MILKLNLKMMKANLWSKPRKARDLRRQISLTNSLIRERWKRSKTKRSEQSHTFTYAHPYSKKTRNIYDKNKKNSQPYAEQTKIKRVKRQTDRNSKLEAYLEKLKDIEFQEPANPAKTLRDDAYARCFSE